PIILLALVLAVTLGPSFANVVVAIAVILWARYARVIYGEVVALMERDFIAQARALGASPVRIIAFHLFPNTANTLVVLVSLQVGYVIIVEAALSFLGAGIPPPTPAWGSMIAEGGTTSRARGGCRCSRASRSCWSSWPSTCWGTGSGTCSTRGSASSEW